MYIIVSGPSFLVWLFLSTAFKFDVLLSIIYLSMQVNVNLAGLPALVLPCGFVKEGSSHLPVGLQMIGAAFNEVVG